MKLYLIRHGQTDWNIQGRIQGRHDIALNEMGRKQAECLAQGMEHRPVCRIFSSTQMRAFQTAEIVGRRQQTEVSRMQGLEEVEFGQWEGLTWSEIEQNYPEEYKLWCAEPAHITPPGGESREDIFLRCKTVAEKILTAAQGDVAVVSHGATLAYLLSYLIRKQLGSHDDIIVKNASITTLQYDIGTGIGMLLELNDASHLEGMEL